MNTAICPHCDASLGVPDITDLYDVRTFWIGCDVCGRSTSVTVFVEHRVAARPSGVQHFAVRPVA